MLADLAKYLQTRKSIRDLVGANAIFRARVPSDFKEAIAIILTKSGRNPFNDLLGEPDKTETNVQIDIVANTINVSMRAERVAEAIRQHMSGFRGQWGDTEVKGCTLENDQEFPVPPPEGSNTERYQISLEYRITHTQPAISGRGANS